MTQTTAQPTMTAGAASYPPHYNASSAVLERNYRRYIHARLQGDLAMVDLSRAVIDSTLRRVGRGA